MVVDLPAGRSPFIARVLRGLIRPPTFDRPKAEFSGFRSVVPNRSARAGSGSTPAWIAARTLGVVVACSQNGSACPHPASNVPPDRSCHEKRRAPTFHVIIRDGKSRSKTHWRLHDGAGSDSAQESEYFSTDCGQLETQSNL